ncbi:MAG: nucleotidyltransferase [Bacilli bacterium]|nr:nucleotidyltransferase [Bacilli bacterium]
MKATGIICEYNPFHNGHFYHLQKVKEMFKEDVIVLVMTGHFSQRGEPSIINKWDKTKIALTAGVDLVVELPFVFGSQSADIFAKGSIDLLDALHVSHIVFGTESNHIEALEEMADIQLTSTEYQNKVKELLEEGNNYPTAMAKALQKFCKEPIRTPNDLLGLSYIKRIKEIKSLIKPISIQRMNDYHDLELKSKMSSASAIRKGLQEGKDISSFVPSFTLPFLTRPVFQEDYFSLLKYKILTEVNTLEKYQTVDEGLPSRIQKNIIKSPSFDTFIQNIKTKRYTYNKLSRMSSHILCNFTKEEAHLCKEIEYIRILGFTEKGKKYLHKIKKEVELPLVTKFGDTKSKQLEIEQRVTSVYASVLPEKGKQKLIEKEYKQSPIFIEEKKNPIANI